MKAASTDERGVAFSSSATYRADGNGEIDLDRDPSLSGSYVGAVVTEGRHFASVLFKK